MFSCTTFRMIWVDIVIQFSQLFARTIITIWNNPGRTKIKIWGLRVLVMHAKIVNFCRINTIVGDSKFQKFEESRTFEMDGTPRVLGNLLLNVLYVLSTFRLPHSEYWFNGTTVCNPEDSNSCVHIHPRWSLFPCTYANGVQSIAQNTKPGPLMAYIPFSGI